MNDDWDNIRLDNYTSTANITTPVAAPVNKEQSSGLITAVFFISLHVVVVLAGMLADATDWSIFKVLSLSRSNFVRTAVATVVISSLSVAAGALDIGKNALLESDSSEGRMVIAIVSYVVADTVGRELV
jgi:phosphoglycerol transferase MdoB-like AlkP superfamily enzyme